MTDTNTAEREALMKLVDAYAEASFDQGLHQRTEDDAPEAARKKLEKALRDALAGRASLAASAIETNRYADGTTATGIGPLPKHSPSVQHALRVLTDVESMLDGANGPTIQIRAVLESLAASAGSEPVAQLAAERDELFQAAIDFIRTLTGMEPPPIEVAPPEVFSPFRDFVNTVQAITNKRHPSPPEGMAGWRDIATAPKDEMYRDGPNAYAEYILVWYPGAIAPIRARWWQSDSGRCNFLADGSYAVFPTVWMPLPAPPLPASEAKEL